MFKMNKKRDPIHPEQPLIELIKNTAHQTSTFKYDHSRPEKLVFPDLPPESDNSDSDKRKVSNTRFFNQIKRK